MIDKTRKLIESIVQGDVERVMREHVRDLVREVYIVAWYDGWMACEKRAVRLPGPGVQLDKLLRTLFAEGN